MKDFLEPFRALFENVTDPFERHVLLWCAENYVPLRTLGKGEVHVVFYETLCEYPVEELQRLSEFLGAELGTGAVKALQKPSETSKVHSAVHTGSSLLVEAWRSSVSERQLRRTMEMVGRFGLETIYGKTPRPLVQGEEVLSAFP